MPLGKPRSSAAGRDRPVRVDPGERGVAQRGAAHEVEAEVAHVGAAVLVHDHVVEHPGDDAGQVGVLGQRPDSSRTRMRWSRIDTMSARPSGRKPSPDGWPGTSAMTSVLPRPSVATTWLV